MNLHLKTFFSSLIILLAACSSPKQENNTEEPAEKVTEAVQESKQEDPEIGATVYNQYCVVCHMKDGAGVEGLNPPLTNSEWVNGDKNTLIKLVLNGSEGGNYPVNGEVFGNAMTTHSFLSDEEIAGVLTYVRSNFENNSDAITAEEVAVVRGEG